LLKRGPRKGWAPIVAALMAGALALTPAGWVAAQPQPLPPEQAFRFSARAIDPTTIEARFDVVDGYYLYRDKLSFAVDPVPATKMELPPGKAKHDDFFGDVLTYRGVVVVRIPLARAAAGQTLTVHAQSQGCADIGICYPPTAQRLRLVIPAAGHGPGPFVQATGPGNWFN
jgi:thiol:disulfide interchange protein DsbD